jgi:hypothetical protein
MDKAEGNSSLCLSRIALPLPVSTVFPGHSAHEHGKASNTCQFTYSQIKYLGIYGPSLLIEAARIFCPASSQNLHPSPIQLLDETKKRVLRDVTRESATKITPQKNLNSFLPSPNIIRPSDLWIVSAQANRKGSRVRAIGCNCDSKEPEVINGVIGTIGISYLQGSLLVVQSAILYTTVINCHQTRGDFCSPRQT